MNVQFMKEYQEFLKQEKQLGEKKRQYKLQLRKDLNDQIKFKEDLIVSLIMLLII